MRGVDCKALTAHSTPASSTGHCSACCCLKPPQLPTEICLAFSCLQETWGGARYLRPHFRAEKAAGRAGTEHSHLVINWRKRTWENDRLHQNLRVEAEVEGQKQEGSDVLQAWQKVIHLSWLCSSLLGQSRESLFQGSEELWAEVSR